MAQIFHPSINTLTRAGIITALTVGASLCAAWYGVNLHYGQKLYVPIVQPVQFSHKHHSGDDGIDCRYCHTSVEKSAYAGMPATHTCMSCHSQIWSDSAELAPVRASYVSGQPIQWNKVHDMPDFVYFNHAMHIKKGVGCESCHGNMSETPLAQKVNTMTMTWCLNCHRHPENYLRPRSAIYTTGWKAADAGKILSPETGKPYPTNQKELGAQLVKEYKVLHQRQLTDCYTCHH